MERWREEDRRTPCIPPSLPERGERSQRRNHKFSAVRRGYLHRLRDAKWPRGGTVGISRGGDNE
eukprot:5057215-Pyramimonas_sp.AAC.1